MFIEITDCKVSDRTILINVNHIVKVISDTPQKHNNFSQAVVFLTQEAITTKMSYQTVMDAILDATK